LAMVVEQAGGMATDGKRRILDIDPQEIHQRVPLFIGSKDDVVRVMEIYKTAG
jgi:fructose-1,6-bisphosphatase I